MRQIEYRFFEDEESDRLRLEKKDDRSV